jgi:molybdate transport system substrate-binding protein
MKRSLSLAILLTLFLSACGSAVTPTPTVVSLEVKPKTLTVFAAASLTDAFAEIGKDFEAANSGVTVKFNFAGSQALRTQIEEGAPADVFASANNKEMDMLIADKLISEGIAQNFLTNKLIVILPENNPARIEKLEDLAKPKKKLVLAAEAVPVGKYALQSLDLMDASFGNDFKKKVLANVVSNEDNVKQVVAKVQLGEADGGIVYISDKIAAPDLKTVEIPAELNVAARYPIAPLSKSANAETAKAFIDYVLSSEGQSVLQKWGFAPVK